MKQNKHRKGENLFRGYRGRRERYYFEKYITTSLGVPDIRLYIDCWEQLFQHWETNEGTLTAVLRAKAVFNFCCRYSSGIKAEAVPFLRAQKDGLPSCVRSFKTLLLGSHNQRRAGLAVLQLYKLKNVKAAYTFQSVTDPFVGDSNPSWLPKFRKVVQQVFKPEEIPKRIRKLEPGFHVSGANGPNGPALGTAYVDRQAINNAPFLESLFGMATETGFAELTELLDQTKDPVIVNHKKAKVPLHSRISIKYEPGGKARPFAIYDFFSQSALKGIHRFAMNYLKTLPTDSSSDHSKAAQAVKVWTADENRKIWSYDLTSATDRFPVYLQEIVVTAMFGDKIGKLWKDIMTNRTFTGPEGELVRWNCGQPLGALSSWAVFSITHHLLLQTAVPGPPLSKGWYQSYRMIGDDIAITGPSLVASRYKEMLDSIKVSVSIPKSVLPEQCSRGNAAEIAKRVFQNGIEVTPVPPNQICAALSQGPSGTKSLITSGWKRGYSKLSDPYTVQSLLHKRSDWLVATFPFRNSPPLTGVRVLFPEWDENLITSQGLNPNWFLWHQVQKGDAVNAVRYYVLNSIATALAEALKLREEIEFFIDNPLDSRIPKEGGGWKPGPTLGHPQIISAVLEEMSSVLGQAHCELLETDLLEDPSVDIFHFIGRLHVYLEPRVLLEGRNSFMDEKIITMTFLTTMVRSLWTRHENGTFNEPPPGAFRLFGGLMDPESMGSFF